MEMETPPEEKIITNCSKYLRLLEYLQQQGIQRQLFRGDVNIYKELTKKKIQKRKPSMTPQDIFEITDEWFDENFGVRARSESIFATTSHQQASEYGNIHYVFPIKNFTIIHSDKVDDLFAHLNNTSISIMADKLFGQIELPKGYNSSAEYYRDKDYDKFKESIRSLLDHFDYKKNDYKGAFESGNEIMVITKNFYIVEKQQWVEEFINEFVYEIEG